MPQDEVIRVLCIIDSIAAHAGTENQLMELIRRIDKSSFRIHLCCLEDSVRLAELEPFCAIAIFPVSSLYSWNGFRQVRRLRAYIDRHGIDIVQTFMVKSNIAGVLAARGSRCGVVIASRRNAGHWQTALYVRIMRYINRYTTRLLANSAGARRSSIDIEGVAADKVDVIYNGVDLACFAAERGNPNVPRSIGIPDTARVVGIVANLRPVKDLPLFLRAARLVAARVPDAAFVIVGRGSLRDELGALSNDLGLTGKVFFSEGRGEVVDYLRRMSVACLSSQAEGFSNAILEYMAAGLPVVATDVGGNAEAVEHGVTGYIVRERTPEAFARPIIDLLENETMRSNMAAASLERCRRLFDINIAVRRHQDYYAALAAPGSRK
jgi:glycosyltransferase involved in cell wall biosynthesis